MDKVVLPLWQELPDIPLYMDQVVYVINGVMGRLEPWAPPAATPSTVNSYVKAKLVPAPEKKKYGREQLSRLVMIYVLKRALSISEIGLVLEDLYRDREEQAAYDLFVEALHQGVAAKDWEGPPLLQAAVAACCGKLRVEEIIAGKN